MVVVVVVVVARRVVKRMHEKAKIIIEFVQVYRVQVAKVQVLYM